MDRENAIILSGKWLAEYCDARTVQLDYALEIANSPLVEKFLANDGIDREHQHHFVGKWLVGVFYESTCSEGKFRKDLIVDLKTGEVLLQNEFIDRTTRSN